MIGLEVLGAVSSCATLFKVYIAAFELIQADRYQEKEYEVLAITLEIERAKAVLVGSVNGPANRWRSFDVLHPSWFLVRPSRENHSGKATRASA